MAVRYVKNVAWMCFHSNISAEQGTVFIIFLSYRNKLVKLDVLNMPAQIHVIYTVMSWLYNPKAPKSAIDHE